MGILITIQRKNHRWYLKSKEARGLYLTEGLRYRYFTDMILDLKGILRMRWRDRAEGWVR